MYFWALSCFVLNQDGTPQKSAEKLVQLANDNGGPDNISVIVVKILPPRESKATMSASHTELAENKA